MARKLFMLLFENERGAITQYILRSRENEVYKIVFDSRGSILSLWISLSARFNLCYGGYFLGSLIFPIIVFVIIGILGAISAQNNPPVETPSAEPPAPTISNRSHQSQFNSATDLEREIAPESAVEYHPPTDASDIIIKVDRMNGLQFEHWCGKLLCDLGYQNVTVTQGSGDQGVDVTAEKDEIKYAIQCKCYSSDLGNHPIQEVHAGKSMYNCHVGVVMTNRHFTSGAKNLAKATGTLLWDRDKLLSMIGQTLK